MGDLVVLDIFAKKIKEDASEGESIPSAERIGILVNDKISIQ